MKKINKGYTLAEMLLTLGIISVVAGITIPALVSNTRSRALEPTADRTAVCLEEEILHIITKAQKEDDANSENVGDVQNLAAIMVSDVLGNANNSYLSEGTVLFDACGSIMGLSEIPQNSKTSYLAGIKDPDGNDQAGWDNYKVYRMKKMNVLVTVRPVDGVDASTSDNDKELTRLYIDANGERSPNRIFNTDTSANGDIFEYRLLNNGNITRRR